MVWSTYVINMYLQVYFLNKLSSSIWSLIFPFLVENQIHIVHVNEDEKDKYFMKTTVCIILIIEKSPKKS